MVALLRHHGADPVAPGVGQGRLRLVVDNSDGLDGSCRPDGHQVGPGPVRRRSQRPVPEASTFAPGLRGQLASFDAVTVGLLVAAAVVVFGGLLWVRVMQGGATAESWDGVEQAAASRSEASVPVAVPAGAVDGTVKTVVAGPGDSLWSIALEIAPDSDPRPVVAALIEANGGESVQIGQQIVIPEQLLD